jgi:hypothetical protein
MTNIDWIAKEAQNEVNEVLEEFGLPKLCLTIPIWNTDEILKLLKAAYKKEIEIQKPYGGIRKPSSVFHNKIRHTLTNYDEVRDALTEAANRNMDAELVLIIQEELIRLFSALCQKIISFLPKEIRMWDSGKKVSITHARIKEANERYENKALALINKEKLQVSNYATS